VKAREYNASYNKKVHFAVGVRRVDMGRASEPS
jgi:hypothetical protein